jgi:ssDNA-binding Zn-finger/Zn-ribbon topoisomerase 1
MKKGDFNKGHIPWNKGLKTGLIPKSAFKKGNSGYWLGKKRPSITGKLSPSWKGNNVGYNALHAWVYRNLGKASKCIQCNNTKNSKRFEWANISREYKRDLSDWKELCSKCHHKLDNITNRGWETRRRVSLFV